MGLWKLLSYLFYYGTSCAFAAKLRTVLLLTFPTSCLFISFLLPSLGNRFLAHKRAVGATQEKAAPAVFARLLLQQKFNCSPICHKSPVLDAPLHTPSIMLHLCLQMQILSRGLERGLTRVKYNKYESLKVFTIKEAHAPHSPPPHLPRHCGSKKASNIRGATSRVQQHVH
jgi:hypothetical protein